MAYIARCIAIYLRTGRRYDFRGKGPVEATGLAGWDGTIEQLMDAASAAERRKKAVEGRVAILALPHELSQAERLALVQQCAAYLVRKYRVAVFYAIHPPPKEGGGTNWHSHLLWTSREVVDGLALGKKTRELDAMKTGGKHVEAFRAWWCNAMNTALTQGGHRADVEHRSFRRLGIRAKPTRHQGEPRTAIARRRAREKKIALPPCPEPKPRLRVLRDPVVPTAMAPAMPVETDAGQLGASVPPAKPGIAKTGPVLDANDPTAHEAAEPAPAASTARQSLRPLPEPKTCKPSPVTLPEAEPQSAPEQPTTPRPALPTPKAGPRQIGPKPQL